MAGAIISTLWNWQRKTQRGKSSACSQVSAGESLPGNYVQGDVGDTAMYLTREKSRMCKTVAQGGTHQVPAIALLYFCDSEPPLIFRYDSFGRLTNVTFPTGQVSSFRSDTDSSVHVQVETSSKDDVTITTNLSASGAFYTLLQGKPGGALGDSEAGG